MLLAPAADEAWRGEAESGFEGRAEADPRGPVASGAIGEEPDAARLAGDGDDELAAHHAPGGSGRLQVNADQDVVEALAQQPRQVLVVNSVEKLRLVQVTAESVSHSRVPVSTQSAVQLQRVIVELTQLRLLRQLHDVHTPAERALTISS